jgi:N-acetylneuraminate synthase
MMPEKRVFVVAEAGVNHNGVLDLALGLVDAAVEAGADAIKFQTFKAEKVISRYAAKADYQTKSTDPEESQLDMVRKLELSHLAHNRIYAYCEQKGVEFMSTPFDLDSVDFLVQLGVSRVKIPSGEMTNAPLLLKIALTGLPVFMSTGMASLAEVETALGVLAFGYLRCDKKPSLEAFHEAFGTHAGQEMLKKKVTLLHCTTDYPAAFEDVNLRAMETMGAAFNLPVGYSDHTPGIVVPIAAVARGATVIEKHFTLDKTLPGPDHQASLEPWELKSMVLSIRQVEAALGSPLKFPAKAELKNREIVRKSLVAAQSIRHGERFSEGNLTSKRPGYGISPLHFWDWLGREADRDYAPDDLLTV